MPGSAPDPHHHHATGHASSQLDKTTFSQSGRYSDWISKLKYTPMGIGRQSIPAHSCYTRDTVQQAILVRRTSLSQPQLTQAYRTNCIFARYNNVHPNFRMTFRFTLMYLDLEFCRFFSLAHANVPLNQRWV